MRSPVEMTQRTPESLTVSTSAVGLAAIPSGATLAWVTVDTSPIRYWNNGTPTSTVGHKMEVGDGFWLLGSLASFRAIRDSSAGADAVLRVSYWSNRES